MSDCQCVQNAGEGTRGRTLEMSTFGNKRSRVSDSIGYHGKGPALPYNFREREAEQEHCLLSAKETPQSLMLSGLAGEQRY